MFSSGIRPGSRCAVTSMRQPSMFHMADNHESRVVPPRICWMRHSENSLVLPVESSLFLTSASPTWLGPLAGR
jgi:hypothetical protein